MHIEKAVGWALCQGQRALWGDCVKWVFIVKQSEIPVFSSENGHYWSTTASKCGIIEPNVLKGFTLNNEIMLENAA